MSEEKKVAATESSVAEQKVTAFREYLKDEKVSGFMEQKFDNPVHAVAFRSFLPVQGQNLPFMILLDDSVYSLLQFEIAAAIVTKDNRAKVSEYLNDLNDEYRMLKYTVDKAGNVILTCSMPSGVEQFDPSLIIAVLNQIQGHLTAVYPDIMKKIWEK